MEPQNDASGVAFLEGLGDDDRQALLDAGPTRRLKSGELLARAGERARTTFVLLDGYVKVHRVTGTGADVVLGLCGPGDLLGEAALRQARRSAAVTTVAPVALVEIAAPQLRELLEARPPIALAVLDVALSRLYAADARRIEAATSPSLARVASRLVELADRFGVAEPSGEIEVALPINQEELASWSATSKESSARALRTLRELHTITTRRGHLTVHDLGALRRHAARL